MLARGLGERNDLGARPLVALLHTFRGIVEAGVEGVEPERAGEIDGRVADVNEAVAAFELDRLFANDRRRLGNKADRHTQISHWPIRRRDIAAYIVSLIQINFALSVPWSATGRAS